MARSAFLLHISTVPRPPEFPPRPERHLDIEVLACGHERRAPNADTGWRSLPAALFESPRNGRWELSLKAGASGTQVRVLGPGDVAALAPGTLHRLRSLSAKAFITDYLLAHLYWISHRDLLGQIGLPQVMRRPAANALARALSAIPPLSPRGAEPFLTLARRQECCFRALGQALAFASTDRPAVPSAELERLAPALAHLRSDSATSPSIAALADGCGLSVSRFHVLFKRALGTGPKEYVMGMRMRRASQLLLTSASSLEGIAEACGFSSAAFFCRQFKIATGQTPGEFRRGFRGKLGEFTQG